MNSKPILKTYYPMEKEASEVYTRNIFRKFQEELVHSQQFVAETIIVNHEVYSYKVHEFDKEKPDVMVYSLELSEKASKSQKHYDVAIESLQRLFEELDALKIEDEKTSSIDVLISENLLKDQETHILTQNITLLDPPHVITKGRPRSCESSQVIVSNLNAPRTYGSIQIDEDSSVAHNCYQGQGSMSLQFHPTNFTDLIASMQELPTGTNKKGKFNKPFTLEYLLEINAKHD
ncbi:hypothetical protein REPUB_Repub04eG0131900 [Reevesia pubescens]